MQDCYVRQASGLRQSCTFNSYRATVALQIGLAFYCSYSLHKAECGQNFASSWIAYLFGFATLAGLLSGLIAFGV